MMYSAPSGHTLMLIERENGYLVETFADPEKLIAWLLSAMEREEIEQIRDVTIKAILAERGCDDE